MDYSILAIWGAILSTLLAGLKIWEVWSQRRRIELSYNFTGDPEVGNEVIIRNLGHTPIIITFWELLWIETGLFGRKGKQKRRISAEHDFSDIHVAPHSSTKLIFSEEHYFRWSAKSLSGKRIYFRLSIAGEARPRMNKLYP